MNAKVLCVICGCIILTATVTATNGSDTQTEDDHRLILTPGQWKIRSLEPPAYVTYNFNLGLDVTKQQIVYPACARIACQGHTEYQSGCSAPCLSGTWHQTDVLLQTTIRLYDRAVESLDASFTDLAAIMDTHIMSATPDWTGGPRARAARDLYSSRTIDVMEYYRAMMRQSLSEIKNVSLPVKRIADRGSRLANSTRLVNALEMWKIGVYTLATHLNTMISTIKAAEQRLVLCSEGVVRSDMTGCEPHLSAKFHTDTPILSKSVSVSKLTLLAMRKTWEPLLLSRWFMPFVDTSRNNRVCWLAASMLTDGVVNYKMPYCDARGLCDPLQLDETTVSSCEVDAAGIVSLHCPLQCGAPCNGPVCYDTHTKRYNVLASQTGASTEHGFNRTIKPRSLSQAQSLTDADLRRTLAYVNNITDETSSLWQRTQNVFSVVEDTRTQSLAYVEKVDRDMVSFCDRVAADYQQAFTRLQILSYVSLILSVLTCPLLVIICTKIRSSSGHTTIRRKDMEEPLIYHAHA